MNTIYTLLFISILSLGLCACGQQTATQAGEAPASADQQEQAEQPPFQNIDVQTFEQMRQQQDVVLLDVRTPEETAQGKIDNALEANVLDPELFAQQIDTLPKDKTYLVYCRSGRRSERACNLMAEQGFEHLYNLEGGYQAWKEKHP